jgi:hypothetical protein
MSSTAKVHRVLGFVFLGISLVMFFLAGLASFGESWDPHAITGSALILLSLILLVLAAAGRREALQASAVLFGLMIVQMALAIAGREDLVVIGALHPVNALLILFVAHQAARGLRLPVGGRSTA